MPADRRGHHQTSAGGVVYRRGARGTEFALIKAAGRWSFPKGSVEKGESAENAALREIAEETGLPLRQLRIVSPLPDVNYAFQWRGVLVFKTVHHYLVQFSGEAPFEPQLSEIEEAGWFAAEEARRIISFKNARETLEAALVGVEARQLAS